MFVVCMYIPATNRNKIWSSGTYYGVKESGGQHIAQLTILKKVRLHPSAGFLDMIRRSPCKIATKRYPNGCT